MKNRKQYISSKRIQAICSIIAAIVIILLPFDFYGLDIVVAIGLIGNGIYQWQKSGRSAS
jgi:hypothetical protein